MRFFHAVLRALLAGAVAGLLVLGIAGRLATVVVALVAGTAANLSWRGMLDATVAGVVIGSIGGLLLALLGWLRGSADRTGGLIVGVVMFGVTFLFLLGGGRADFGRPLPLITYSVVAIAYLAYGVIASALLRRFEILTTTRIAA